MVKREKVVLVVAMLRGEVVEIMMVVMTQVVMAVVGRCRDSANDHHVN